jgi:hypothetical protein
MQPDHLPSLGPGRNTIETKFAVYDITFHAIGLNLLRRIGDQGPDAATHRRNTCGKT